MVPKIWLRDIFEAVSTVKAYFFASGLCEWDSCSFCRNISQEARGKEPSTALRIPLSSFSSSEALCGVAIDIWLGNLVVGESLKVVEPVPDDVSAGIPGEGSHTVSPRGDSAWLRCPAVPVHPPCSTHRPQWVVVDLIRVWIYLL